MRKHTRQNPQQGPWLRFVGGQRRFRAWLSGGRRFRGLRIEMGRIVSAIGVGIVALVEMLFLGQIDTPCAWRLAGKD